jgi:hypothetical protein
MCRSVRIYRCHPSFEVRTLVEAGGIASCMAPEIFGNSSKTMLRALELKTDLKSLDTFIGQQIAVHADQTCRCSVTWMNHRMAVMLLPSHTFCS